MASNSLNSTPAVQEYSIRVPKTSKKKLHIMRFNHALKVDISKWSQVKLERENNLREYHGHDEETPKFGAGSEFGKEQREEARRKKYGIILKRYKPEDQPWILKVGGKTGKKFKGIREGGVSANASYYVFTHAPDGAIDAYPLNEWYNFQPIQRYKALSAEEAEQEFGRRNKTINFFNLMTRKRLRNEDTADGEDGEEVKGKKGKGKGRSELKISEMDEWIDSGEEMTESDEDDEKKEKEDDDDEDEKKKGKKADDKKKKKKKKKDSDEEAFEESDDGDEEGREVDYISDSSLSGSDLEIDEKGVAEEDALKKLLNSDEDDDEDEEKKLEDSEPDEEKEGAEGPEKKKEETKKKKKKKKKEKKKPNKEPSMDMLNAESSTSYSSDSSVSDVDNNKKKSSKNKESNSDANSRSASPTAALLGEAIDGKRKNPDSGPDLLDDGPSFKKPRLDNSFALMGSNDSGITEDAVRRYLIRKPMTTTELLQKFKKGKTGLTSEQLVNIMTQILKRINPIRQTIKGKMYLSLKA